MRVKFLSSFAKDLDKITDTAIKGRIVQIIETMDSAKLLSDIKNLKKIIGYKNAYRIKSGSYRIGFYFENGTIELARVIHRKDIYKKFP